MIVDEQAAVPFAVPECQRVAAIKTSRFDRSLFLAFMINKFMDPRVDESHPELRQEFALACTAPCISYQGASSPVMHSRESFGKPSRELKSSDARYAYLAGCLPTAARAEARPREVAVPRAAQAAGAPLVPP